MPLNASSFIQNRKKITSITDDRITHIMSYAIECYNLLLAERPTYSKTVVSTTTNHSFEDYLKMEFVDSYLIKNKHLLAARISSLEDVTFTYETIQRFIDTTDTKEKKDKIDVYVNKLGLKNEWAVEEEHLYLAIECKRISVLPDCQDYVEDIQKFCDRAYLQLRIPFESQIAFIENSNLDHISISTEINRRLKLKSTIMTKQFLKPKTIHKSFKGSYGSVHKKNYHRKAPFTIFHLLFDYSQFITT